MISGGRLGFMILGNGSRVQERWEPLTWRVVEATKGLVKPTFLCWVKSGNSLTAPCTSVSKLLVLVYHILLSITNMILL